MVIDHPSQEPRRPGQTPSSFHPRHVSFVILPTLGAENVISHTLWRLPDAAELRHITHGSYSFVISPTGDDVSSFHPQSHKNRHFAHRDALSSSYYPPYQAKTSYHPQILDSSPTPISTLHTRRVVIPPTPANLAHPKTANESTLSGHL